MKEEERNKFEDMFRSKLQDFEADTLPEDWDAIVDRLPVKAPVPFRRTLSYWVAAAVVSLCIVTGSMFLYEKGIQKEPVAQDIKEQVEAAESEIKTEAVASLTEEREAVGNASSPSVTRPAIASLSSQKATAARIGEEPRQAVALLSLETKGKEEDISGKEDKEENTEISVVTKSAETVHSFAGNEEKEAGEDIRLVSPQSHSRALVADAAPASKQAKASSRKWGIGMGAGGLSVGADNMIPQYVTNSNVLRSENLQMMNAVSFQDDELPKTDVNHKMPVSFGLSVSRYLNDRFSLQTGLTYSFLSSEWKTNGEYHSKTKQKLHFIGIPLSLSYKIAEWNRFNFYAAAGAMTEVNVAGKRKTQFFSDTKKINQSRERVRMKEWLWSVNARAGVSYPLIRFVSAFAEVGAGYYFDNGSTIETIHSEKPFNVSLQIGFRLGF